MTYLRAVAALAAFAVAGANAAYAVEVRKVAEVKAPPAAVWAKVGEWCAIKDWHPAIANCEPGKRGLRTLTLKDGGKIVEKITKTGRNTYSYDIIDGPLPVKNYSATLTAKADSLGTTDLVWTAKFDPAKGKTAAEAEAVIAGIFDAGLANIKSNLKFEPALVLRHRLLLGLLRRRRQASARLPRPQPPVMRRGSRRVKSAASGLLQPRLQLWKSMRVQRP